jgi:hypothetical protein
MFKGDFFYLFFLCTIFNTALPAAPFRFHYVGGCWYQTGQALAVRLSDLSARSHPQTRLVIIHHSNKKDCATKL